VRLGEAASEGIAQCEYGLACCRLKAYCIRVRRGGLLPRLHRPDERLDEISHLLDEYFGRLA